MTEKNFDHRLEKDLEKFKNAAEGDIIKLSLDSLKPSQQFDGRFNESVQAVPAFIDKGKIVLLEGNHRYWTHVHYKKDTILVKKVANPYTQY